MSSTVDIWNLTSASLGVATITTTADNNQPARVYRSVWGPTRRRFLSSYPWTGGVVNLTLVNDTAPPGGEFPYSFRLPDTVLRVWDINYARNAPSTAEWSVVGRSVWTTAESAVARCSVDLPTDVDLSRLTESAAHALAMTLAADVAIAMGKNQAEFAVYAGLAMRATVEAKNRDTMQSSGYPLNEGDLTRVRY